MPRKRWSLSKYLWLILIITSTIGGIGAYRFFHVNDAKPSYILNEVERGDITLQVAATGTLAAVTTVQVGTQVSGTVESLYADFNSEVKKGQLLAKLDPQLFRAQLEQAEANVRTAEANLNDDKASIASARANLEKAKVDVMDKMRRLSRQRELFEANLISKDDMDSAQANVDASHASEKAAEAQLESSLARLTADQARLVQAQAGLQSAKVNLENTIITSPISGTIISRSVDRGQTVAASLSSPTLFTIGEDLTKMQVSTNIDEADVGKIKAGMSATFTVDAYPGETFSGTISQVRLASTTVQNVVTYNAMIDVANEQLKLKPGMTASVKILIENVNDVLKIPNSALRFQPNMSEQELEQAFKKASEEKSLEFYKRTLEKSKSGTSSGSGNRSADNGGGTNRNGGARRNAGTAADRSNRGRRVVLWSLGSDDSLLPHVARLGLTDGVSTEILEANLQPGEKLIVGLEADPNRPVTQPANMRPPGFGGPMGGGFRR